MEYTGEVIFRLSGIESFDIWNTIKLEDKKEGKLIDLRTYPNYAFQHDADNDPLRFRLVLGSSLGIDEKAPANTSVTMANGVLSIIYPENLQLTKADIFDLQGRMVQTINLTGSGNDQAIPRVNSGAYTVVLGGSKTDYSYSVAHKLFIR